MRRHSDVLALFCFPLLSPMRALIREVSWFIAVGCAAAFTHWSVAVLCVERIAMRPLLANAVGWIIAFLVSFTGHYRLTFRRAAQPVGRAARRFFTISAISFFVNEASYSLLLRTTGIRYDVLLALILIAVAVLTFLASRLWAFRRRPAP